MQWEKEDAFAMAAAQSALAALVVVAAVTAIVLVVSLGTAMAVVVVVDVERWSEDLRTCPLLQAERCRQWSQAAVAASVEAA